MTLALLKAIVVFNFTALFFSLGVTLIELTFACLLFYGFLQSFYGYGDLFSETWQAFTQYDIIHLKTYDSKRVGLMSSMGWSLHAP